MLGPYLDGEDHYEDTERCKLFFFRADSTSALHVGHHTNRTERLNGSTAVHFGPFRHYQAPRLSLGSTAFDRPAFPYRSSKLQWSLQHEVDVYGGSYCHTFDAQE